MNDGIERSLNSLQRAKQALQQDLRLSVHARMYPGIRICAAPWCEARLSIYNNGIVCPRHIALQCYNNERPPT